MGRVTYLHHYVCHLQSSSDSIQVSLLITHLLTATYSLVRGTHDGSHAGHIRVPAVEPFQPSSMDMVRLFCWIGIPLLHVVPRGCLRYYWTYQGSSRAEVEEGKRWRMALHNW
jgi:hypothetical protein